jgi:putative colanic acid biosynthesis acetyltransferase WcaF
MNKTDLSSYQNNWYKPGPKWKKALWYISNVLLFRPAWNVSSNFKVRLLRIFGATIGKGVVIKPKVNIKYPWLLEIGDYCWIGEEVWIDNLAKVTLENNVCISQGALLQCGNHNYKKPTFDLIVKPIYLCEGAWVGAKANVAPGVTIQSHAILTMGSTATSNLKAYSIYAGNPATFIRDRIKTTKKTNH